MFGSAQRFATTGAKVPEAAISLREERLATESGTETNGQP